MRGKTEEDGSFGSAFFIVSTEVMDLYNPNVHVMGHSLLNIFTDQLNNYGGSVVPNLTTDIICSDTSCMELQARIVNSVNPLLVTAEDDAVIMLQCDGYSGKNTFILGKGAAQFRISSYDGGDNPFLFTTGNSFPSGMFNFITKDKNAKSLENRGAFIFEGNHMGSLFQKNWLIDNKLIMIDGYPATDGDIADKWDDKALYIQLS